MVSLLTILSKILNITRKNTLNNQGLIDIVYSILKMETYTYLNSLLLRPHLPYSQFQNKMLQYSVEHETYLNLFLVTLVSHHPHSPQFDKFLNLLLNFKQFAPTKKCANLNYIGYKDRKSVLMHACQKGTPRSVQILLQYNIEWQVRDPQGKSMAFYAVRNSTEEHAHSILTLLLDKYPHLLHMPAINGQTLLHQAVDMKFRTTIELLLSRGINVNSKLKDTGNTISHQLLKQSHCSRQTVLSLLVLLAKYKANFDEVNNQGISVFEKAKSENIDLNEAIFCDLLEKDSSVAWENDNQFDKMSITTLNKKTKAFDTTSQIIETDSQLQSKKVDFSQLDEPSSILSPKYSKQDYSLSQEINLSYDDESDEDDESSEEVQEELDLQALSQEILQLAAKDQQNYNTMVSLAHQLFDQVQRIANPYHLSVNIVGSFATGLWTPRSDINISLVPTTNQYINFQTTIQKIYKKFKNKKVQLGITDIHFLKAKVSSIKITLGEQFQDQVFDIAIFHRNHTNQQYALYITQSLIAFPVIKPLFFTYKHLCQQFELDDPMNGGLKTYALFHMIISVVKNMPTTNPAALFYHIAMYYGFSFEYGFNEHAGDEEEVQSVLEYPLMRFDLIDPLNHRNNIGGKNTKAHQLRNMFRGVYYWLLEGASQPYLQNMLCLQSLLL